jgi:hypothetical protein
VVQFEAFACFASSVSAPVILPQKRPYLHPLLSDMICCCMLLQHAQSLTMLGLTCAVFAVVHICGVL